MEKVDFSKIYSYSKLDLFERCKMQYYFHYLDPIISPMKKQFLKPRDYKTKGHAVHGAITLFYHLPQKKRTLKRLKECLTKAWFSEINPEKEPPLGELGGFRSLRHERIIFAQSLKLLKNFFELDKPSPPIFYLPTKEIKDSYNDYEELIRSLNEKFFISGKFDRIDKLEDGSLRIVDFKTGKNNEDDFQLIFYKLLAEMNFQIPVKTVSFYYLDKGKVIDLDTSKIKPDKIKNRILKKIEKIEKEKDFPPQFSGLCTHCDFWEICPARKIINPPAGGKK